MIRTIGETRTRAFVNANNVDQLLDHYWTQNKQWLGANARGGERGGGSKRDHAFAQALLMIQLQKALCVCSCACSRPTFSSAAPRLVYTVLASRISRIKGGCKQTGFCSLRPTFFIVRSFVSTFSAIRAQPRRKIVSVGFEKASRRDPCLCSCKSRGMNMKRSIELQQDNVAGVGHITYSRQTQNKQPITALEKPT